MPYIGFASAAERDIRRLRRSPEFAAIRAALDALAHDPLPPNLDIVPLRGRSPWLRLRVGNWRILYRPLFSDELRALSVETADGYVIGRIIHRRDLLEAVRTL